MVILKLAKIAGSKDNRKTLAPAGICRVGPPRCGHSPERANFFPDHAKYSDNGRRWSVPSPEKKGYPGWRRFSPTIRADSLPSGMSLYSLARYYVSVLSPQKVGR